jgi:anaerobic ribonucleoside-triphosphate reductase activating protein
VEEIIEALNREYITGLSLLGGEPMEPEQRDGLLTLLRAVRARLPQKTVWCYSGFSFEKDLLPGKVGDPEKLRELLSYIDVLVDGKFVEELKDPSLLFRGSSNQNIIDVKKSLEENRLVLLAGTWRRTMGSGDIHDA